MAGEKRSLIVLKRSLYTLASFFGQCDIRHGGIVLDVNGVLVHVVEVPYIHRRRETKVATVADNCSTTLQGRVLRLGPGAVALLNFIATRGFWYMRRTDALFHRCRATRRPAGSPLGHRKRERGLP